jgi:hypothetical protein
MTNNNPKSFNPWPLSIVAFFVVAICGVVGFAIFCFHNKEELVAADYYEQEVRYQDQLDRAHRASSLQAPARISYDTRSQLITVLMPAAHLDPALKGWIQLYRPSAASMDQKLALQVNHFGAQTIDTRSLSDGLWHVRISWNLNGKDYYFDQKVVIEGNPT